jgi:cysteine synthase
MGTSGTMTGIGQYFKKAKPSVYRIGCVRRRLHQVTLELMHVDSVSTKENDLVPGPRTFALLSPVEFPWRDSVDAVEEVGSLDAYGLSLRLCREGLISGPSSGLNLQGTFHNYLNTTASVANSYRSVKSPREAQSRWYSFRVGWTVRTD